MAPDDKAWGGCGPLTARDAPASCCCSGGGLDSAETKRRTDKRCAESGMGRFRGGRVDGSCSVLRRGRFRGSSSFAP
jgi:hypothetical protein